MSYELRDGSVQAKKPRCSGKLVQGSSSNEATENMWCTGPHTCPEW